MDINTLRGYGIFPGSTVKLLFRSPAKNPCAYEKLPDIDDELAEMIRSADIVILDPPRAGCRPELLEAAVRTGAGKIVYVSCNPATLARDVKLLGEMGYEFKEATPVDMFPHTSGIEAVAKLIRRS